MGLSAIQAALAGLATNTTLRERFFADPVAVGAELGLEASEACQLSAAQVTFYARSLHAKRQQEVAKLLPATCQILGERLTPVFRAFAETYVPTGVHKHREDARAFACFLHQNPTSPAWLDELARYEATWLMVHEPTFRGKIGRFRYPLPHLIRQLAQGEAQPFVAPCVLLAVWWRLAPQRPLRFWALRLPALPLPKPIRVHPAER